MLLSGTLERADGRAILWLPYKQGPCSKTREVDLEAPGLAVVGYRRAQALAEKAVLPVVFGAIDGEAEWLDEERRRIGPQRISGPPEVARAAVFTALHTGFARDLLRRAFDVTRSLRAERWERRGIAPGAAALGLGKLLVVAPDQEAARKYLAWLRGWVPRGQAERVARIATSDERDAHETLAAFRLPPEPSVLVTVAMAYEGLDAPETSVVACMTQIRSRAWLEQMIARATRMDPNAGAYDDQRALVFHPDDVLFRKFRERIEREQGTLARSGKPHRQGHLPLDIPGERADPIVPLSSNATALRWDRLAPGPDFAAARPEQILTRQSDLLDLVVVGARDAAAGRADGGGPGRRGRGGLPRPPGAGAHHAYSAALKRNRLSDHLHLLEGDGRFTWTARQRQFDFAIGARQPKRRQGSAS